MVAMSPEHLPREIEIQAWRPSTPWSGHTTDDYHRQHRTYGGSQATRSILRLLPNSPGTDSTKSLREMLRRSPTTISLTQDDITRYDEARKQKLEAQHMAQQSGSSLENVGTGSRVMNGPADKQKVRTAEQRIMGR